MKQWSCLDVQFTGTHSISRKKSELPKKEKPTCRSLQHKGCCFVRLVTERDISTRELILRSSVVLCGKIHG
jgi:hypothetical protein